MSDLIDREALIKSIWLSDRTVDICQKIERAPAVDAVPVVRCKDCKKRNTSMCHAGHEQVDMDYCSHGEPKENA